MFQVDINVKNPRHFHVTATLHFLIFFHTLLIFYFVFPLPPCLDIISFFFIFSMFSLLTHSLSGVRQAATLLRIVPHSVAFSFPIFLLLLSFFFSSLYALISALTCHKSGRHAGTFSPQNCSFLGRGESV